jgi:hypothetical protein
MPVFDLVAQPEAQLKTATGKRAAIIKEYLGYIDQLKKGQAGRLQPAEGESVGAVRRRLGAAAKLAGKELVIKRADEEVYFWVADAAPGRRRGRPKKAT